MRTKAPSPRRSLSTQRRVPSPSSSRLSAQPERTRGRKPYEVAVASTSLAPTAEISRLAPGRTTIVRPASLSVRRRSTRNSTLPTWTRAPSRSRARTPIGLPSRNVPWVEPASSTQAPSLPTSTRAWWRETERSSSWMALSAARPIERVPVSGTRAPSGSTTSSAASTPPPTAVPQLGQNAAPRETCRRQLRQSGTTSSGARRATRRGSRRFAARPARSASSGRRGRAGRSRARRALHAARTRARGRPAARRARSHARR